MSENDAVMVIDVLARLDHAQATIAKLVEEMYRQPITKRQRFVKRTSRNQRL